jgi:hypothetical protein
MREEGQEISKKILLAQPLDILSQINLIFRNETNIFKNSF